MTCAACPITIKKALTKVDSVTNVEVSFERKDAVVSFDDTKTSVPALIEATINAWVPLTSGSVSTRHMGPHCDRREASGHQLKNWVA
jgi:copper chaperone CopZ